MCKKVLLGVIVISLLISSNLGLQYRSDAAIYVPMTVEQAEEEIALFGPNVVESFEEEEAEEVQTIEILVIDSKQRDCLARAIYWEARNQSLQGMIAVGLVVMNRVRDGQFANTPCEVVYQGCQFSWVCSKRNKQDPAKVGNDNDKQAWAISISVANELLLMYDTFNDITKGAIYFHAYYVKPNWSTWKKIEKTVRIDDHIFYRIRSM